MFILPKRKNNTYKKDYGSILILAGNESYGGAAILAARAALYSGAGLITLATHPSNHIPLHSTQPEVMLRDWGEDLSPLVKTSDVILVGPGLGTDAKAKRLFKNTLDELTEDQTLVLDASALHLFKEVNLPRCKLILTPHLGEMRKMSELSTAEINDENCLAFAKKHNAYLILKGHQSKLYYDDKIYDNIPGTPAMASGGAGDVLAGMIAGFAAQFETLLAIRTALYLHSKIAIDLARDNYVVLPSQIIKKIPSEMKKLEEKERVMI
ncbi:MAG: NAD(P)H-hydrate dehydratase [Tissierellia bacterium]|nr:NAD(P)H-hydrate dehydratase [Tissierellia bacterium]